MGAIVILTLAGGQACSQTPPALAPSTTKPVPNAQRVFGEYLVTLAPGADKGVIRKVYGGLRIKRLTRIGDHLYRMTIEVDPGLKKIEALRLHDRRITAIQPNFIYRSMPSLKAE